MALRNRIEKLEKESGSDSFEFVVMNEGETEEQADKRCFPDGCVKPKAVFYLTPEDLDI